ncbi:type I polyketide synthase [Inquilinus sp. CA228]|uniref:type I polyketide synthase n=1 Tax=Inquilinus sp. CA228 TaxID=3455609 RepID=UPI003F8CFE86
MAFDCGAGDLRYGRKDGSSVAEGDAGGDGESDIEIVLEGMVRLPDGDLLLWVGITQPVLFSHLRRERYETAGVQGAGERRWRVARQIPADTMIEPIAIVGMSCRLPGAPDLDAYWTQLVAGADGVGPIPAERWDLNAFYDPDPGAPGRAIARHGGFLDRVDGFDPLFFRISPREAMQMDPQQRLMLELAWESLEDAGIAPSSLRRLPVGVFVGAIANDYTQVLSRHGIESISQHTATGMQLGIIANRISHALALEGPSLVVDTACSASLVAVHLACQSLRAGETTVALAGGVHLILAPESMVTMSKLGALSPGGRSRPFDARADGYARGEGGGVIVLKPLLQARADGDRIYAVIRGSAVNNDGPRIGLTAPSQRGQEAMLRLACRNAGVEPSSIHYVEAHGTGTRLGDPVEAGALGAVLGADRSRDRPLLIGSVKANIGHLEGASGIAGLIKATLAVHHRQVPPTLHFEEAGCAIPLADLKLAVPTRLTPWPPSQSGPARAGVSAFGFGGTNCHVILEAEVERPTPSARPEEGLPTLMPVSARSPAALADLIRALGEMVRDKPNVDLSELAAAAAVCRDHHQHRAAIVAGNLDELATVLDAQPRGAPGRTGDAPPRLAFVFSGQGSQWLGMGRELLKVAPVFRAALEACGYALGPLAGHSLLDVFHLDETRSDLFRADDVVQPCIFAVQVALAALLQSWGVRPDIVVGHSMGEVAAAHVAGALTLREASLVIRARSRLAASEGGSGGMALVELGQTEVENAIAGRRGRLSVAACNSPTSTVISGNAADLDAVIEELARRNIFCRRISVDYASHSRHMTPILPQLRAELSTLSPRPATIPFFSTVTGRVEDGRVLDGRYWAMNLSRPVLFAQAMQLLIQNGVSLFLELSPHPLLLTSIRQCMESAGQVGTALASLRRGEPEFRALLHSLGSLYTCGCPIDFRSLHGRRHVGLVRLPLYPWQRQRCRIGEQPADLSNAGTSTGASPCHVPADQAFTACPVGQSRDLLEAQLRRIASQTLGLPMKHCDVRAPLPQLGLDSLLATEVSARFVRELGMPLPVAWLLDGSSIAAIAARLGVLAAAQSPVARPAGDPAIVSLRNSPNAPLRLICFAHAGGGIPAFRGLARALPGYIECLSTRAPVRGGSQGQLVQHRFQIQLEAFFSAIRPYLDRPFAFFGHSMGALVAFELARRLISTQSPGPLGLFVSGCPAPDRWMGRAGVLRRALDDPRQDLRAALEILLGDAGDAALVTPDLARHTEETLRADLSALADYAFEPGAPLDIPIAAFGGDADGRVSWSDLEAWLGHTTRPGRTRLFPGGHFYFQNCEAQVARAIGAELATWADT